MNTYNTERHNPYYDYTIWNQTSFQFSSEGGVYREVSWKKWFWDFSRRFIFWFCWYNNYNLYVYGHFEHLIRPITTFMSPQNVAERSFEIGELSKICPINNFNLIVTKSFIDKLRSIKYCNSVYTL